MFIIVKKYPQSLQKLIQALQAQKRLINVLEIIFLPTRWKNIIELSPVTRFN